MEKFNLPMIEIIEINNEEIICTSGPVEGGFENSPETRDLPESFW